MAQMTQDELDRRLAELGGGRLVHSAKAGSVKVPNPSYDKYDPKSTETIDVDVEQWRSPQGHVLQAAHMPDGTWNIVRDEAPASNAPAGPVGKQARSVIIGTNPTTGKPSEVTVWDDGTTTYDDTKVPAASTTPAAPPVTQDQSGRHLVWQPNPGGPDKGGQWVDVGPSTPEKPAIQQMVINGQPHTIATSVDPATGQPRITYYGPDGKPEAALPGEAPTYSVGRATINGKVYTTITATPKDGTPPTITNYGPDGQIVTQLPTEVKPGTRIPGGGPNKEDIQAIEDPEHPGQIKYVPIPGAAPPPGQHTSMPPGVTPPDFSGGKSVSAEMARFISELDAAKKAGLITAQEATDLAAPYHQLGTTALQEQTQQLNQQNTQTSQQLTQRSQDITQRSNRATMAQGILNTAIQASQELVKGADPKNFKPTLIPLLALQGAVQFALGAMKPVNDVQTPALASRVAAPAPAAAPAAPTGDPWLDHTPLTNSAPAAPAAANPVFRPAPPTNVQPSSPAVTAAAAGPSTTGPTGTIPRPGGPDIPPPGTPVMGTSTTGPTGQVPRPGGPDIPPPVPGVGQDVGPSAVPAHAAATDTRLAPPPDVGTTQPYNADPSQGPVGMAPTGNAMADRVDTGVPPTIEQRAKQLIDQGANPHDVYFAMYRFLKKQGIDMFGSQPQGGVAA